MDDAAIGRALGKVRFSGDAVIEPAREGLRLTLRLSPRFVKEPLGY